MKKYIPLFFISFFLLSSCSLNKQVQRRTAKAYKKAPYDLIIVPGYPYQAESNKELFTIRLHWAKELYEKGVAKNVMFSGDAVHTPYTEGQIMKRFAVEMGIPEEHVFEENQALHTDENVKYSKKLAKELGFHKFAFATDPYQFAYMKTLVFFFANGTPIFTFSTDSMAYYSQPLPEIDIESLEQENWSDKTK